MFFADLMELINSFLFLWSDVIASYCKQNSFNIQFTIQMYKIYFVKVIQNAEHQFEIRIIYHMIELLK